MADERNPASQSPYERVSDSNPDRHGRRRTRLVSIPLRTGLGFEHGCLKSRTDGGCLNPLTNGSRIRTSGDSLDFQPGRGLNPLTNGSRIRTHAGRQGRHRPGSQSPYERVSDSNYRVLRIWHPVLGLNPLTNGSRIRTAAIAAYLIQESVSIPLRTGLGFEHRPIAVNRASVKLSQSPYERVSDSNFWRLPMSATITLVSIPLRTGLGFELPCQKTTADSAPWNGVWGTFGNPESWRAVCGSAVPIQG